MGRRRSRALATVSRDSSPSSAESSFRELDDVFLQRQARLWLGEVLHRSLDDELPIYDLLADGQLLFEVSKVMWTLLLAKCVELKHLKAYQFEARGAWKGSERYMPYSNVDSFLKVCKVLGLSGVDLFSPSDVVEKRNIRKVCMCIRSLSKKARWKQLNVPDFDMVTFTVDMPTDMVGGIRKSLESSLSSISSSSTCGSDRESRPRRFNKKNLKTDGDENSDCRSDVSDEAESKYMGAESESETSPGTYYFNKGHSIGNNDSGLGAERHDTDEILDAQWKQPLSSGLVESLSAKDTNHDADYVHSSCFKMPHKLNGRGACPYDKDRQAQGHCEQDFAQRGNALANDGSILGDLYEENGAERDCISHYLAFSDSIVHGNDNGIPVLLDEEDCMYNFFNGIDSYRSDSNKRNLGNGFQDKFADDTEDASSITSMSSVVSRMLNLDLDDQSGVEGSLMGKGYDSEMQEADDNIQCKHLLVPNLSQSITEKETPFCSPINLNGGKGDLEGNGNDRLLRTELHHDLVGQGTCGQVINYSTTNDGVEDPKILSKAVEENHLLFSVKAVDIENEAGEACCACDERVSSESHEVTEGGGDSYKASLLNVNISTEKGDHTGHSGKRPSKKHLLEVVARGSAIAGVLFLLLHLSQRVRANATKINEKPTHSEKVAGPKVYSKNTKKAHGVNGIYPSDKLKI